MKFDKETYAFSWGVALALGMPLRHARTLRYASRLFRFQADKITEETQVFSVRINAFASDDNKAFANKLRRIQSVACHFGITPPPDAFTPDGNRETYPIVCYPMLFFVFDSQARDLCDSIHREITSRFQRSPLKRGYTLGETDVEMSADGTSRLKIQLIPRSAKQRYGEDRYWTQQENDVKLRTANLRDRLQLFETKLHEGRCRQRLHYADQILSDIQVRTKSAKAAAHRSICLSAIGLRPADISQRAGMENIDINAGIIELFIRPALRADPLLNIDWPTIIQQIKRHAHTDDQDHLVDTVKSLCLQEQSNALSSRSIATFANALVQTFMKQILDNKAFPLPRTTLSPRAVDDPSKPQRLCPDLDWIDALLVKKTGCPSYGGEFSNAYLQFQPLDFVNTWHVQPDANQTSDVPRLAPSWVTNMLPPNMVGQIAVTIDPVVSAVIFQNQATLKDIASLYGNILKAVIHYERSAYDHALVVYEYWEAICDQKLANRRSFERRIIQGIKEER